MKDDVTDVESKDAPAPQLPRNLNADQIQIALNDCLGQMTQAGFSFTAADLLGALETMKILVSEDVRSHFSQHKVRAGQGSN